MSLFSFLRKNKQEPASDDSAFYSRAEEESKAVRSRTKQRRKSSESGRGADPVDPVLPEKKRARRRLIGAVALVLAAVIGLPMILDSEPKPVADDITIQIPSKDKITSSNTAHPTAAPKIAAADALDPKEEVIDPPVAPTEAAAATPADAKHPDVKAPETKESGKKPETVATAPEASKAKSPAKHEAEVVKTSIVEKPAAAAVAPAPKTEARTDAKAAEHSKDAARAKALLEGKADPAKAAEKRPGKFVIQVAALASKEKVDELQSRLKGAGIKSYTQKVATSSGDRIRIRVGPFANKEEAEKVRAKVNKLGLNGTLVPA
ncbi:MAG TPA: SPOR domain-containing protein [Noviherbaspirillum sp.]|uniref:SPOR domain-containing protein n=1 Tax=Noviherbaspirillum sp. TaxID=1926288 RepID=UPI002B4955FC|nr:SPOR domain-containing protein [Noviherbaspirillum sp.]HJV85639.1 SPOR domain-containing protein [Noviherbaspirillum sp.]